MAKYKNEVNEYLKDRIDIVDVISSAVDLKRAGRNHKGLCPFHSEKTPSFMVNEDKRFYHCFGCGESGDIITFLMKYENMEYLDAIETLAERYSIDLAPMLNEHQWQGTDKKPLYQLMRDAARHFFSNIQHSSLAQDYLRKRGVSPRMCRRFGLGFAEDQWDNLLLAMKKKGYSQEQLLDCGLIIKNESGRYYDRFRNRLIFPIFDSRARVIAFGGRVLDDALPKYLNSPETLLFHKSNLLYGLNFAMKTRGMDTVYLVEGYMDVIAMHQYGFTTAVATLGTALTESHVKALDRLYDKLVFAYDSDGAGQKAIMNSLDLLANSKLKVKILKLSKGKDPDEVLKKYGAESLKQEIANAQNTIEFRIEYFAKEYDLSDDVERIDFLQRAYAEIIHQIPSRREFSLQYLAERLDLPLALIQEDFGSYVGDQEQKMPTHSLEARAIVETGSSMDKLYRIELMLLRKALSGRAEFLEIKNRNLKFYYQKFKELMNILEDYYQEQNHIDIMELGGGLDLELLQFLEKLLKRKDALSSKDSLEMAILSQNQLLLEKEIDQLNLNLQKLRLSNSPESKVKTRAGFIKLFELKKQAVELSERIKKL